MRFTVLVVLVLLLAAVSVAGADLSVGIGGSLYSEQTTEVVAGVNALVTLHDSLGGTETGWANRDNFVVPVSSYEVTKGTSWIRVKPEILDIPPDRIRSASVVIEDCTAVFTDDRGALWVNVGGMVPGKYFFIVQATHNASKREARWLILIRKVSHIWRTDERGFTFAVQDVGEDVRDFIGGMCRVECESKLSVAQKGLLRSYIYSQFADQIGLAEKPADWRSSSTNRSLFIQGARGPLQEGPLPPNPELEALRQQVEQLKAAIAPSDQLAKENVDLKAQLKAALETLDGLTKALQTPPEPSQAPSAPPAPTTDPTSYEQVGKLVVVLRAQSPDGQPAQVPCEAWAVNGVKSAKFPSPMSINGEGVWALDVTQLRAKGWTSVKVGSVVLPARPGVQFVTWEGGDWHAN